MPAGGGKGSSGAGGRDGTDAPAEAPRFEFKVEESRVYLTVHPAGLSGQPATKDDILIAARGRGYTDMDNDVIGELVAAADGRPRCVGVYVPKAASVNVRLTKDDMQAILELDPPDPGGKAASADDLRAHLRAAGVIFGVKEDVIQRLAETPEYGADILVAEGRPVEQGVDGWIDYQFELERHIHLKRDEDSDRVDFKELNLIENVVEGQLLAVKKHPTPGVAGVTVKNEYVAPKPGREIHLLVGRNVTLSPDGNEAFAATNGLPLLLANKVTVSQVYVVKGSVGPATGNINFLGTVQVTDSVEDGFSVKATDQVLIAKTVGKAEVEAGGDIKVRGGIIEGKCVSGGSIRAKFVQESTIEAKEDVIVAEAILHSHVNSGNRIVVGMGGRKGTIAGGQLRAWRLVACRVLGSPMSTKTTVDVGINPKLLQRMEELQAEIIKDRTNFENLKKGMMALEALKQRLGQLPPDKQKIQDTLVLAQNSLRTKLQELAGELKDLQAQAATKVQGMVSVSEDAHPGVKITIGTSVYYVNKMDKFVTYKEEGREVRLFPYEAPKGEKTKGGKGKKDGADDEGGEEEAP